MKASLEQARRLTGHAWDLATESLYRNAFLIMLSSVISSGLGFFFWLVVARFYAATDVGYAVALIQTLNFLAALAHLGLGTGIIRHLPETEAKVALVNTSATLVGVGALIIASVFFVGVTVFVPDLSFIRSNPVYLILILITVLAIALPAIYDSTSYAMRRADVLTWRTLTLAVVKIPLAAGFAFSALTQGRLGVFSALAISYVAGTLLEALALLPRIMPGFHPRPQLRLETLRPMLRFSLGNYSANSIGVAGGLLLPVVILDVVGPTGAESVAYFYIASVVASLLGIIPGGLFTSFYAEASQRESNRHADERKAILLSLSLLVPGIAVLWIFSREMLTWFGNPAYAAGAVGPLRILIFGSIPGFLNSILSTRVRIRRRSAPLIVGNLISTVVVLSLGVLLLQSNGINGLAIATVAGNAVVTPYYYAVARKSFKDETQPPEPGVLPQT